MPRGLSPFLLLTLICMQSFAVGCGESNATPSRKSPPPSIGAMGKPPKEVPEPSDKAQRTNGDVVSTGRPTQAAPAQSEIRFVDVAEEIGISFLYENGESGRALMVEATGGGVAWFDYDSDGELDLLLNQGGDPTSHGDRVRPKDQLFRNIGSGIFEEVSARATIDDGEYSQGVTVGDFDNDGFDDVYSTGIRHNVLFHNQGDGTFVNITNSAKVDVKLWSTSGAWGDLDGDGDLDLYVCTYVNYDANNPVICRRKESGASATCHPKDLDPVHDECFENLGDGSFRAVAREWKLLRPDNRGLGIVIADLNNDRLPDLFVANDTTANFLYVNHGKHEFEESAALLGCAVSATGTTQANMGIAVGDYDGNGFLDLYVTHFTGEWNTMYRNLGPQGFQDRTAVLGLVEPTLAKLGFGTVMADFDLDGNVELFVANGHIERLTNGGDYEMEPQLFTKVGNRFRECGPETGDYFRRKLVGRGVALGDFDNDGDWDLAISHQNSLASVLRNDSRRGHWLKVKGVGRISSRTPIGLRVTVTQEGRKMMQELIGGGSYCATNESALIFGFGSQSKSCQLEVQWPSGKTQQLENVAVDQSLVLLEPVE